MRLVQQARKDAGFEVTDRITLTLALPHEQRTMVETHERHLTSSVLATSVAYVEDRQALDAKLDGVDASFGVARLTRLRSTCIGVRQQRPVGDASGRIESRIEGGRPGPSTMSTDPTTRAPGGTGAPGSSSRRRPSQRRLPRTA